MVEDKDKALTPIRGERNYFLVGGTALSLMYGYSTSVDLDLFCINKFDNKIIINPLQNKYKDRFDIRTSSHFGIFGFIDDVKIDIVRFPHPLIRPTLDVEGIRMYSTEEIVAMRVQAILNRGKKKDFWDVAELIQHFTVKDFRVLQKEKYSTQNLFITVLRSSLTSRMLTKAKPYQLKRTELGQCKELHTVKSERLFGEVFLYLRWQKLYISFII